MSQLGVFDPFYNPFGTPPNPLQTGAEAFAQATQMAPTYGYGGATQYGPEIPDYTFPEFAAPEQTAAPAEPEVQPTDVDLGDFWNFEDWNVPQPQEDVDLTGFEVPQYEEPTYPSAYPEQRPEQPFQQEQPWETWDNTTSEYWAYSSYETPYQDPYYTDWNDQYYGQDVSYEDDLDFAFKPFENFSATTYSEMPYEEYVWPSEEVSGTPRVMESLPSEDEYANLLKQRQDEEDFANWMIEASPAQREDWWREYIKSPGFKEQYPDIEEDEVQFGTTGMPVSVWRSSVIPEKGLSYAEREQKRSIAQEALYAAQEKAAANEDPDKDAVLQTKVAKAQAMLDRAIENVARETTPSKSKYSKMGLDELLAEYMGVQNSVKSRVFRAKQLRLDADSEPDPIKAQSKLFQAAKQDHLAAKELQTIPQILDEYRYAKSLSDEDAFLKTPRELDALIKRINPNPYNQYRAQANIDRVIQQSKGLDPRGPDSHQVVAKNAMLEFATKINKNPGDWSSGELAQAVTYAKEKIVNDPNTQKWWELQQQEAKYRSDARFDSYNSAIWSGVAGLIDQYLAGSAYRRTVSDWVMERTGLQDLQDANTIRDQQAQLIADWQVNECRQAALEKRVPRTVEIETGNYGGAFATLAGYVDGFGESAINVLGKTTGATDLLKMDPTKMTGADKTAYEGGKQIARWMFEMQLAGKVGSSMRAGLAEEYATAARAPYAKALAGLRTEAAAAEAGAAGFTGLEFAPIQRQVAMYEQALVKAAATNPVPWLSYAATEAAAGAAAFTAGGELAGDPQEAIAENAMLGAIMGLGVGGLQNFARTPLMIGVEARAANAVADTVTATRAAAAKTAGRWLGEGAENWVQRFRQSETAAFKIPDALMNMTKTIDENVLSTTIEQVKARGLAAGAQPHLEGRAIVRELAYQYVEKLPEGDLRALARNLKIENAETAPLSQVLDSVADSWSLGFNTKRALGEFSTSTLESMSIEKGLMPETARKTFKKSELVEGLSKSLTADEIVELTNRYNSAVVGNAMRKAALDLAEVEGVAPSLRDTKIALQSQSALYEYRLESLRRAGQRHLDSLTKFRSLANMFVGNGEDLLTSLRDTNGQQIGAVKQIVSSMKDYLYGVQHYTGKNHVGLFENVVGGTKGFGKDNPRVWEVLNGRRLEATLDANEASILKAHRNSMEAWRKDASRVNLEVDFYNPETGKIEKRPMPEDSSHYVRQQLRPDIVQAIRDGNGVLIKQIAEKFYAHPEFGKNLPTLEAWEKALWDLSLQNSMAGEAIGKGGLHARIWHNLPVEFADTNLARLNRKYAAMMSQKIAGAESFGGPSGRGLRGLIDTARKATRGTASEGEFNLAKRYVLDPILNAEQSWRGADWLNTMTQFEAVTNIFLNVPLMGRQIVQPFLAPTRYVGVRRIAQSYVKFANEVRKHLMTGKSDYIEGNVNAGICNGVISFIHDPYFRGTKIYDAIMEPLAWEPRAVLRNVAGASAKGFQLADTFARSVSAVAGRDWAVDAIRYLNREPSLLNRVFNKVLKGRLPVIDSAAGRAHVEKTLRELYGLQNLDEILSRVDANGKWTGFTPDETARLMYEFARTTNFARDPLTVPTWMSGHPAWRMITLFQSFGYQQSRQSLGALREVFRKNPLEGLKQVTSMAGGAFVAGEFEAFQQWLLYGRERQEEPATSSGIAARMANDILMSGQLGLIGNQIQNGLSRGYSPAWLADIVGLGDTTTAVWDAVQSRGSMTDVLKIAGTTLFPPLKSAFTAAKGRDRTEYETLMAHIMHARRVGKGTTWWQRFKKQMTPSRALEEAKIYNAFTNNTPKVFYEYLDERMKANNGDVRKTLNAVLSSLRANDPAQRVRDSNFYDMDELFNNQPQLLKYFPSAYRVHQEMAKWVVGHWYEWQKQNADKYGFDTSSVFSNNDGAQNLMEDIRSNAAPYQKSVLWETAPKEYRALWPKVYDRHRPLNQSSFADTALDPETVQALLAIDAQYGSLSDAQLRKLLKSPRRQRGYKPPTPQDREYPAFR